ncbi:MAG: hypothetical protein ACLRM8_04215 [Alistipes sp.]
MIDDAKASYDIVKRPAEGIPVVSGNKTMLATTSRNDRNQKKHNVALLYDASSCGSIPSSATSKSITTTTCCSK